jgi:CheY-like chemotaxis protein
MVCKVVSIEDEPEIAELLRIVLASPEIEIYSCDNGPDGVVLVRACKPDLVILDIMLPGMNGWAVYDAIRADEALKMTPIVMLSVLREEPGRRQAFVGSPIDLYVTKPFDTVRLRSDIERMLGRKGIWPVTKPLVRGTGELKPIDAAPDKPEPALSGNGLQDAKPTPDQPSAPAVEVPTVAPAAAVVAASESGEKPLAESVDKPPIKPLEKDETPPDPVVEKVENPPITAPAAFMAEKPPDPVGTGDQASVVEKQETPPATPSGSVSPAEKPPVRDA